MAKLKLGMVEYAKVPLGIQGLNNIGQCDSVPQSLLQLDDGWKSPLGDVLYPFFSLSYVAKILVGLKELALLIHPVSSFPPIPGGSNTAGTVGLIGTLESAASS
jgi:hypothetical protein